MSQTFDWCWNHSTAQTKTFGVNEAENPAGEQFGMERLVDVILQHGTESLHSLQTAILDSVTAFTGGQAQRDDITVLLVQILQ